MSDATDNAWGVITGQLIYPGEQEVNAREFDDRFLNLLAVLDLSDEVQDLAFRGWIKLTDHQNPSQMPPITDEETAALNLLAQRIVQGKAH